MNSPLSASLRGLLVILLMSGLAGIVQSQPSAGDLGVPVGGTDPGTLDMPSGSDLPGGLTPGRGGPSLFGPAGDSLSSGDGGGQDLPPNSGGGDDGEDDDDDGCDGSGQDDLGRVVPPRMLLLLRMTLCNTVGTITRTARMHIDQRGNKTIVISETVRLHRDSAVRSP